MSKTPYIFLLSRATYAILKYDDRTVNHDEKNLKAAKIGRTFSNISSSDPMASICKNIIIVMLYD